MSPRAIGVEYLDSNGETHMIHLQNGACNEVILSAGALGSPQLLLLSGVGPCRELVEIGIPCVNNLPDVGAHMVDNPCNPIFILSPKPVETALISVVGITREGVLLEGGSGGNWSWQFPAMGEVPIVPPIQRTNARLQSIDTQLRNLSANVKMQINKVEATITNIW
jgi:choline dehydrogenase-like flavoprotein